MNDFPQPSSGSNGFPPPPPLGGPVPGYPNPANSSSLDSAPLSTALAGWTYWLLIAVAVLAGALAVVAFGVGQSADEANTSGSLSSLSTWVDRARLYDNISPLYGVVSLATGILLIIFSFKAYKAAQMLWFGPRKWSRGWSVGGWFIPFANCYIPVSVLIETDKISRANRSSGRALDGWQTSSRDSKFVVWFVLYTVGILLVSRIGSLDTDTDNIDEYVQALRSGALGYALVCAACLTGAAVLKKMAARLSASSIG